MFNISGDVFFVEKKPAGVHLATKGLQNIMKSSKITNIQASIVFKISGDVFSAEQKSPAGVHLATKGL